MTNEREERERERERESDATTDDPFCLCSLLYRAQITQQQPATLSVCVLESESSMHLPLLLQL